MENLQTPLWHMAPLHLLFSSDQKNTSTKGPPLAHMTTQFPWNASTQILQWQNFCGTGKAKNPDTLYHHHDLKQ